MKRHFKSIVETILPDRLWITIQSVRSRNTQIKYLREGGFLDIGKSFVERYGRQVLHGPFAGMSYPLESAQTRHVVPRLVGSYELELHAVLETLTPSYDCVVDIGSAEGYYAVGLARRLGLSVYAFETDYKERNRTRSMAEINGVAHLVKISGAFTRKYFLQRPDQRMLIISDCEGFERKLFEGQVLASLRFSDLIIETHGEGTEALLLERLSKTHRLQVFPTLDRRPEQFDELKFLGKRAGLAITELRLPQSWIWGQSMAAAAQPGTQTEMAQSVARGN